MCLHLFQVKFLNLQNGLDSVGQIIKATISHTSSCINIYIYILFSSWIVSSKYSMASCLLVGFLWNRARSATRCPFLTALRKWFITDWERGHCATGICSDLISMFFFIYFFSKWEKFLWSGGGVSFVIRCSLQKNKSGNGKQDLIFTFWSFLFSIR